MATRKNKMRKVRTARRHKSSTAGKILPPLDVRSNKQLSEFQKRITKGPLTIVLVYADWCGHCHTMMPHFDAAAKSPNRSVQAVKVNEQMLPEVNNFVAKNINKSAKPINVEGYPSIIVVNNKGEKVTDIEPVRNTETMTKVMENAGPLAVNAGIVNSGIVNSGIVNKVNAINVKNKNNKRNQVVLSNIGVEEESGLVEGTPLNSDVGEDELKGSVEVAAVTNVVNNKKNNQKNNQKNKGIAANKLNSIPVANMANAGQANNSKKENLKNAVAPSPLNTFNSVAKNKASASAVPASIEKEAEAITSLAAPIQPPSMSEDIESISNTLSPEQKVSGGGRGGSLMAAMARTTYSIATPAALLATAAFVMRKKSRKLSKKKHTTRRHRK
jgi:thiol-disulfide isomerase/thioredoxin